MTFEEVLDRVLEMLQRRGRVTYRTLKRQFNLDDAAFEDLKEALLYEHPQVVDDPGQGLRWQGDPSSTLQPIPQDAHPTPAEPSPTDSRAPDAERRQLTVLFCDLVDSTVLASQLDPEEWREVVRAYQATCAEVIARFEGHIAQYLGDGLLVYFGYPQAHEDDAQRAVRTGLGMVEALGQLNARLARDNSIQLAVRLGIHTGLVVVGEMGAGGRQERLALGETPNVAARLQSLAPPNWVVISASTRQLLGGAFDLEDLGIHPLKGVPVPLRVYGVGGEGPAAQARAETMITHSNEHRFRQRLAQGTILRGWALAVQGEAAEGIRHLRQGLADHRATGAEIAEPYFLAMLAEAYGSVGQSEEGLTVLAEALAAAERTGERFWEAELYRLQGELLLRQAISDEPQAEACFLQALDTARRQQAKALELRAAMSLSRLWQRQGQRAETRQLLTAVYGWFTEGFDTADLQEAKALLEELS